MLRLLSMRALGPDPVEHILIPLCVLQPLHEIRLLFGDDLLVPRDLVLLELPWDDLLIVLDLLLNILLDHVLLDLKWLPHLLKLLLDPQRLPGQVVVFEGLLRGQAAGGVSEFQGVLLLLDALGQGLDLHDEVELGELGGVLLADQLFGDRRAGFGVRFEDTGLLDEF